MGRIKTVKALNANLNRPKSGKQVYWLSLIPKEKYQVKKSFKDYDKIEHPIGEVWDFESCSYAHYDDGYVLHLKINGEKRFCRLQCHISEQAEIIDNFIQYVERI